MLNGVFFDSLDSEAFSYTEFHADDSTKKLQTIRLQFMTAMIFGTPVIIPPGYALDSLGFIRVAAEIIEATKRLESGFGGSVRSGLFVNHIPPFFRFACPPTISTYSDLVAFYADYAACQWSGLPPLRNDDQKCILRDMIRTEQTKPRQYRFDPTSSLVQEFGDLIGDCSIGRAWMTVANYLESRDEMALVNVNTRQAFDGQISRFFNYLETNKSILRSNEDSVDLLLGFRNLIRNRDIPLIGRSMIFKTIDESYVGDSKEVIRHFVSLIYHLSLSSCMTTAAHISSYAVDSNSLAGGVEALIRKFFHERHLPPAKLGLREAFEIDPFTAAWSPDYEALDEACISRMDWSKVWDELIRCVVSAPWKDRLDTIKKAGENRTSYEWLMHHSWDDAFAHLHRDVPSIRLERKKSFTDRIAICMKNTLGTWSNMADASLVALNLYIMPVSQKLSIALGALQITRFLVAAGLDLPRWNSTTTAFGEALQAARRKR